MRRVAEKIVAGVLLLLSAFAFGFIRANSKQKVRDLKDYKKQRRKLDDVEKLDADDARERLRNRRKP